MLARSDKIKTVTFLVKKTNTTGIFLGIFSDVFSGSEYLVHLVSWPRRISTKKSHLYHVNRRSGWVSNPGLGTAVHSLTDSAIHHVEQIKINKGKLHSARTDLFAISYFQQLRSRKINFQPIAITELGYNDNDM
jgi:hypothetical protein